MLRLKEVVPPSLSRKQAVTYRKGQPLLPEPMADPSIGQPSSIKGGDIPKEKPSLGKEWHPFQPGGKFEQELQKTGNLKAALMAMPDADFAHNFSGYGVTLKQQLKDPGMFQKLSTMLSQHLPIDPKTGMLKKVTELGGIGGGGFQAKDGPTRGEPEEKELYMTLSKQE
jgi:hypothetical protein